MRYSATMFLIYIELSSALHRKGWGFESLSLRHIINDLLAIRQ